MVIVGAGHAGGRTAQALREAGWDGPIRLIGDEAVPPYERPPLSKAVLLGRQTPQAGQLLSEHDWRALGVRWQHARATALYPSSRWLLLDNGEMVVAEAIVLATGGKARRLSLPGAQLPGVFTLRTAADAQALQARLQTGQQMGQQTGQPAGHRVLVVGGGFIGLEVAASARTLGCEVTLLEAGPRLMGRAVPAWLADPVAQLHQQHGVQLITGVAPERLDARADGALCVTLQNGQQVVVDTVVVGIGIQPNIALAEAAGLAVRSGIVVDRCLATSAPGIFAAGDVAEFPSVLSGQSGRQETWQNAENHARCVALGMLGQPTPLMAQPWFWSDQYDHQLQVSGEPALGTQEGERLLGDGAQLRWSLDARERIVGVCGFGPTSVLAREMKLARTLLERGVHAPLTTLCDPATKLKALLR